MKKEVFKQVYHATKGDIVTTVYKVDDDKYIQVLTMGDVNFEKDLSKKEFEDLMNSLLVWSAIKNQS